MPYIRKEDRDALDPTNHVEYPQASSPGELNFQITRLIDEYLERGGLSYAGVNTVVGVLECAKLELYRRIAAPYEDTKIASNGDVYRCNNPQGKF